MRMLFLCLILSSSMQSYAVERFDPAQIQFSLWAVDSAPIKCTHKPNKTVPQWWDITCGTSHYTADVWIQYRNKIGGGYTLSMMYHVKESTSSSGERRVRFDEHYTSLTVKDKDSLSELSSALDVRNGIASLNVEVKL